MAHENNPNYAQSALPRFLIVVDGKYYCGEDELVSNPNKFNDPWSGNSFHTNRVNMSGMKFDSERENAKIIDGRMNLVSHVKRVLDYCTLGETQPNKIVIEKAEENSMQPFISPAQCIDNLRTRKEEIIETLSKLMYWMDKAREGQEIDLDKFNVVWKECEDIVNHG